MDVKFVYVPVDLDPIQVGEGLTVEFQRLEGLDVSAIVVSIQQDAEAIRLYERYTGLRSWDCGRKIAYLLTRSGMSVDKWLKANTPQISRSWAYKLLRLYTAFATDPKPLTTLTTDDALEVVRLVKGGMSLDEALATYKDEAKKRSLKEERQRQRDALTPFRQAAERVYDHAAKLVEAAEPQVKVVDWKKINEKKAALDEALVKVKKGERALNLDAVKAAEEEARQKAKELEALVHDLAPEVSLPEDTIPPDTHHAGSDFEDTDEEILASFADAPDFDIAQDKHRPNLYRVMGESPTPLPDRAKLCLLPPGSVVRVVLPDGRHVRMTVTGDTPAILFAGER